MSRDFWIVLSTAIVTAFLVFVALMASGMPGLVQSGNMLQAEQRLPEVQAIIDADPRLAHVRPGVYTGLNGSISSWGSVENTAELLQLMRAVAKLRVGAPIYWNVQVFAEKEEE